MNLDPYSKILWGAVKHKRPKIPQAFPPCSTIPSIPCNSFGIQGFGEHDLVSLARVKLDGNPEVLHEKIHG